jgi:large subunit ribosomal protein L31
MCQHGSYSSELSSSVVPRHRCGCIFLIGSTAHTSSTQKHSDGNTYPYVALDVSSASHPVYTHQQRKATKGRIAGFNKLFAGFSAR